MDDDNESSSALAEEVSQETIHRVDFLLGRSLEGLRETTVVIVLEGKRAELKIDAAGRATVLHIPVSDAGPLYWAKSSQPPQEWWDDETSPFEPQDK